MKAGCGSGVRGLSAGLVKCPENLFKRGALKLADWLEEGYPGRLNVMCEDEYAKHRLAINLSDYELAVLIKMGLGKHNTYTYIVAAPFIKLEQVILLQLLGTCTRTTCTPIVAYSGTHALACRRVHLSDAVYAALFTFHDKRTPTRKCLLRNLVDLGKTKRQD